MSNENPLNYDKKNSCIKYILYRREIQIKYHILKLFNTLKSAELR